MKSISIVSSYSDSCGNAYFTKILETSIAKLGFNVKCAELNLDVTQSIERNLRKKADAHIKEICASLSSEDGVNIQLESGLYGTLPKDILRRVNWLISANKNTTVTLHSPRIIGNSALQRSAIKSLLVANFHKAFRQWLAYKESSIHVNLNKKLVMCLVNKRLPIIVHTIRAKNQIKLLFDYNNVFVHPLKMVIEDYKPNTSKLVVLKRKFHLLDSDKVIGMFGFINEYKGHGLALEALQLLPKEYKLFIYGRVHPQTIKQNETINPYLKKLKDLILAKKLIDRVYFMGEHSTDDFIDFAATVDVVWLPYVEVGQDGSGIASICCDVSNNVLASTSFAFDELLKLIPYSTIERFDIGNAIELASKTHAKKIFPNVTYSEYTLNTQAALYKKTLNFK